MRAGRLVGVLGGWYTLRSKIQVGRNERRVTWGTILGPNASDARAEICCLCRTSAARGRPSTTRRGCAATLHAGSTSRYATATFTLTSPSAAAPCTRPGPGSTLNGPHPSTPSFPAVPGRGGHALPMGRAAAHDCESASARPAAPPTRGTGCKLTSTIHMGDTGWRPSRSLPRRSLKCLDS